MSRRAVRGAKKRNRTGLYLMAAFCLAIGASLFGLNAMNNPTASEPVNGVSPPETAEAPEPIEKKAEEKPAEEKPARDDKKADKDKKAEEPAREEREAAAAPAIPAAAGTELYLTVPKMGLVDDYVVNDVSEASLMNGAGKIPETGFPWEEGANTYIASHVLGYEGTGSYLHFAELPNVAYGDEITLRDTNGTVYTYKVNEILEVSIYDTWVIDPTGEDIVSLQTCINPPAYDVRLVVRGERVGVDIA